MRSLAPRSGLILRKVKLPTGEAPVYQSAVGQGISSDAAQLTETVLNDHPDTPLHVLELGCGTGIVSLTLSGFRPGWHILGIDILPQLVEIARMNALNTNARAIFQVGDITRPDFIDRGFDLIVSNPPYYPISMGRVSPRPEKAVARHEILCDLPGVIRCLSLALSENGVAYVLYPAFRDGELLDQVAQHPLTAIVRHEIPCRRPGASTHIWRIERRPNAHS
jgi:tRNA1(Val) A37 N6-methylase TrmN6